MSPRLSDLRGVVLLDDQGHARRQRLDLRDQARKQVGSDGVDGAHPQRTAQGVLAGLGDLLDLARLDQHPLGLLDDAFAQLGDLDVTGAALEEHDAELLLDFLDGHGQRRLTDVTLLGGAPEVAFPRERDDVLQIGQCHEKPQRRNGMKIPWSAME